MHGFSMEAIDRDTVFGHLSKNIKAKDQYDQNEKRWVFYRHSQMIIDIYVKYTQAFDSKSVIFNEISLNSTGSHQYIMINVYTVLYFICFII